VPEAGLRTFSREFWEGMAHPHRARHVLGDRGESAPERWRWGGPGTDAVLLLFAVDDEALQRLHEEIRGEFSGVSELMRLDTFAFERTLEHFGFNDGIAQPLIDGFSKKGPEANTLPPGEFILGYRNAYDRMPVMPVVPAASDRAGTLPPTRDEVGRDAREFGRNGTYLVFRQLSQDVRAFWSFVDEAARMEYGTSTHDDRVRMAAKMVGRWPSGAPLTLCPEADDPAHANTDDFGYSTTDRHGHFCPRGAHIRRTNPRDALDTDPEESVKISNRHRVLRRGRPYGAPVSQTMDVDEILAAEHGEEVGLHFICLNSDIGRQFEFVQHTWIINAKFDGLYTDADPLMGHLEELQGTFTMQGSPVRRRIREVRRFVETRGGAYFFLPGMRALKYLSELQPETL
jgi:Dyp-type peroxidase family